MFAQLGKPLPPAIERGLGIGSCAAAGQLQHTDRRPNLSVRAYNCLKRSGLMTVGQVLEKSEDELLGLRNFGRKSYDELRDRLIEMNLLSPSDEPSEDGGGGMSVGRPASGGEGERDGEDLSPLGAALIEALREAGEDPSELVRRQERED